MPVSTIESSPNMAQELVIAKGLRQVADDPRLQRAGANIIARVGGYQYGRNLLALQRQTVVQVKAAHVRHNEIHDKAAGAV